YDPRKFRYACHICPMHHSGDGRFNGCFYQKYDQARHEWKRHKMYRFFVKSATGTLVLANPQPEPPPEIPNVPSRPSIRPRPNRFPRIQSRRRRRAYSSSDNDDDDEDESENDLGTPLPAPPRHFRTRTQASRHERCTGPVRHGRTVWTVRRALEREVWHLACKRMQAVDVGSDAGERPEDRLQRVVTKANLDRWRKEEEEMEKMRKKRTKEEKKKTKTNTRVVKTEGWTHGNGRRDERDGMMMMTDGEWDEDDNDWWWGISTPSPPSQSTIVHFSDYDPETPAVKPVVSIDNGNDNDNDNDKNSDEDSFEPQPIEEESTEEDDMTTTPIPTPIPLLNPFISVPSRTPAPWTIAGPFTPAGQLHIYPRESPPVSPTVTAASSSVSVSPTASPIPPGVRTFAATYQELRIPVSPLDRPLPLPPPPHRLYPFSHPHLQHHPHPHPHHHPHPHATAAYLPPLRQPPYRHPVPPSHRYRPPVAIPLRFPAATSQRGSLLRQSMTMETMGAGHEEEEEEVVDTDLFVDWAEVEAV
ncbi:hypothetical protein HKX48_008968, partial [Thoreauomyces humboldtii]